MSQQINLLVRKSAGFDSTWAALAALGLVLLSLLGLWAVKQGDVARAQEDAAASARQLEDVKARLQARTQRSGTDLGAEIEALKSRAEAARKTLERIGELGSQQGYSRVFSALASVGEDGLWLTSVSVNQGGKSVSISGHALRQESVMHYAERLNGIFSDAGVQFTALELSPVSAGKPGDPGAQLNAVAFKLY